MSVGTYEIRVTLQYAIRMQAQSREEALEEWRDEASFSGWNGEGLSEEAETILAVLNRKRQSDYEPTVELIEENP